MEQTSLFAIGKEFQPSQKLKSLYFIYFFITLFFIFLLVSLPMIFLSELIVFLIIHLPIAVFFLLFVFWIPLYYQSISFKLTEDEIIWKRGVWFKSTGIVPYSKLTNLDIAQGPVARHFGIALIKVQTAGYSGQNAASEIKIEGIEQFEKLRDVIMSKVKAEKSPLTKVEDRVETKMLEELVKIRKTVAELNQN